MDWASSPIKVFHSRLIAAGKRRAKFAFLYDRRLPRSARARPCYPKSAETDPRRDKRCGNPYADGCDWLVEGCPGSALEAPDSRGQALPTRRPRKECLKREGKSVNMAPSTVPTLRKARPGAACNPMRGKCVNRLHLPVAARQECHRCDTRIARPMRGQTKVNCSRSVCFCAKDEPGKRVQLAGGVVVIR
jgi:hypothetical protein